MKLTAFNPTGSVPDLSILTLSTAYAVRSFHESFPEYQETPLIAMAESARAWGVKSIYVKNEAFRFGLNAFKVLGGSYAIGNYIADRLKHYTLIIKEIIPAKTIIIRAVLAYPPQILFCNLSTSKTALWFHLSESILEIA